MLSRPTDEHRRAGNHYAMIEKAAYLSVLPTIRSWITKRLEAR